MCRYLTICASVFSLVSAHGVLATTFDFEPPAYSLGALNGQNGWNNPSGAAQVIGVPQALAGQQSAQTSSTSDSLSHSLSGDWTPAYNTFSGLFLYQPGNFASEVDLNLQADTGSGLTGFLGFGVDGTGLFYRDNASPGYHYLATINPTQSRYISADLTVHFDTGTYDALFNVYFGGHEHQYSVNGVGFEVPVTASQANASSALQLINYGSGQSVIFDNVTLVPEPCSLLLAGLALPLACLIRRGLKRR